jgi:hypothetical protein
MENALLTNLMLFLGALGISFALDGGSRDEDDRPDEADDAAARSGDSWAEEDIATDRDTLAWFLHGEEAVAPLAADAASADDSGTEDSPGQSPDDAQDDGTTLPLHAADLPDAAQDDDTTADTGEDTGEDTTADTDDDPGEVEADVPEDGYADITGYTAGDRLELDYTPVTGEDGQPLPPDFEVQHSEDGSVAALVLDGRTVAMVSGPDVAGLTPDDITLNPV